MIVLATVWILWCGLHSLLITEAVNTWLRQRGGLPAGIYRILYNTFSALTLLPILWYQYTLPHHLLLTWSGPWRIVQAILLLGAAVLFYGGSKVYDTRYFLGISQWHSYRHNTPKDPLPFATKGILRHVRHPWYSGGLAFLWGTGSLTDVTLLVKIILTLYLIAGTLLEEKKLRHELGPVYDNYCKQVPMLIPQRRAAQTQ